MDRTMEIQVIQARNLAPGRDARSQMLRVAAYCRVSTDSEEQETSYEAQINHYRTYILGHPGWILAGIYADEGLSGTQAKSRPQFSEMIAACERGEIDFVITKSISRFARNTLDCLTYIRKLKALHIPILFEKEAANTMEASGELMITILASIAQQESASISQNVSMGIRFGFQEGRGRLNWSVFMGYRGGSRPGEYTIVPKEADVVRRIYREYLEGCSPARIAEELTSDGVRAPAGGEKWYASTVASILGNEKYVGDLLMQKYYVEDFLTHRVVRNNGKLPQYYVRDDHDPIVPREVFRMVQWEKARRAAFRRDPAKVRLGKREGLSGRLVCGRCGRTLKRYRKPDPKLTDWRCRQRSRVNRSNGKEQPGCRCDCRIVREEEARHVVLWAFCQLPKLREEIARMWERVVEIEIPAFDGCLRNAGEDLLKERAWMGRERSEHFAKRAELLHQAVQLRLLLALADQMRAPAVDPAEGEGRHADWACRDAEDFFRRTARPLSAAALDAKGHLTSLEDSLVTRYLHKVVVLDEGYEVLFRAGLRVAVGIRELAGRSFDRKEKTPPD